MFWDLIFLVQYLQAGEPDMGLRTVISMGDSLHCNYFQFVCLPLRDIGLDYIASLPLQTISLYFLLCVFHCTSFLVGSVFFFPLMVILQMAVILMCPLEEVSSGFCYSAMLANFVENVFFLTFFLVLPNMAAFAYC